MHRFFGLLISLFALGTMPALAQTERFAFGGDVYVAGSQASISEQVAHDVFVGGFNVSLDGDVVNDAHAAGFSINIGGDVAGDVYAFGNTVTITGKIGGDVTASGANISVTGNDGVGANLRAAGANVFLTKPVAGSAMIASANFTLGSEVAGDLLFTGETINFDPGAKVVGRLTIHTSTDGLTVPASVASPDRVTIEKMETNDLAMTATNLTERSVKGFWPSWLPILVMFAVFAVVGAIWLAVLPRRAVIAYRTAMAKPWKSLAYGLFALAGFVGLIPLVAVTIIGIPLVPIAIVLLLIVGVLGYVAGVWFIANRVFNGFGFATETVGRRMIALLAGLVAAWLLGLIPFIGWLVQLALVFIGLGALTLSALGRWIDSDFHKALAEEVAASMHA